MCITAETLESALIAAMNFGVASDCETSESFVPYGESPYTANVTGAVPVLPAGLVGFVGLARPVTAIASVASETTPSTKSALRDFFNVRASLGNVIPIEATRAFAQPCFSRVTKT